jgi:tetratricopeptide (TPR) repeat protein
MQAELRIQVPSLLKEFERTECLTSPNPGFDKENLWAGWYYACGEYAKALEHQMRCWTHATDPATARFPEFVTRWQARCASNIAAIRLKLGEYPQAVQWATKARELEPSNPVRQLDEAIALANNGQSEAADGILEILLEAAKFDDRADRLAAVMAFESELHKLKLPAVRKIRNALDQHGWTS